jgi:ketosteroid isomerase-like protein
MERPVSTNVVEGFYQALASRDSSRLAPFLADDVEWVNVGPADILPYCGSWHGKRAVLELFSIVLPNAIHVKAFEPEMLLIDGSRAAAYCRLSGCLRKTGRVFTYHFGQITRFKDDKAVYYRAVIDSFDAAEQFVGHHIEVMQKPVRPDLAASRHIVEI